MKYLIAFIMALFVGASTVNAQHYHYPPYPVVVVRQPLTAPVPYRPYYISPYNLYGYNPYYPYNVNPYNVNRYNVNPYGYYTPYYRSSFVFRFGFGF